MFNGLQKINGTQVRDDESARRILEDNYKQLKGKYPFFRDQLQEAEEKSYKSLRGPEESGDRVRTLQGGQNTGFQHNVTLPVGGAENNAGHPLNPGGSVGTTFSEDRNPSVVSIGPAPSAPRGGDTREVVREFCSAEDLVAIKARAKQPEYADAKERYNSFSTWIYENQNPKNLAEAGFYSTGNEDRVRCFMCNGGLFNFEPEDIPWFEHQRWFGNCPYLHKCLKNPVVAAIIDTAQRINETAEVGCTDHNHGSGQTQCDTNTQVNQTINNEYSNEIQTEAPVDKTGEVTNQDVRSLRLENESLRTTRTCKVCLEQPVSVLFLPCRHLVCCLQCSVQLQECPICRGQIRATATVKL